MAIEKSLSQAPLGLTDEMMEAASMAEPALRRSVHTQDQTKRSVPEGVL